MNLKRIILFAVVIVITMMSVVYANIQTSYAMDAWNETETLKEEIRVMQQEADQQKEAAVQAAAEAKMAENTADRIRKSLDACMEK